MTGFAEWFGGLEQQDPDQTPLRTFIRGNANWPRWSNELGPYRQAIVGAHPTPEQRDQRDQLLVLLSIYFERWRQQNAKGKGFWATCLDRIGTIGLIFFGVVVAAALWYGLFVDRGAFLSALAKVDHARGLITFLFAFSTTSVIILIAIAIFFMADKNEVKERFAHAKDLLTIVIGVLGTILGFYFGSAATDADNVTIANLATSVSSVSKGQSFDISGRIRGGTAPYRYTITFSDPTGTIKNELNKPEEKTDTGGFFAVFKVPDKAEPTSLIYLITARDSKGTQTQLTGVVSIVAPPGTAASTPSQGAGAPSAISVNNISANQGTKATITATIPPGGSPPYTYTIDFAGTDIKKVGSEKSDRDAISKEVDVPREAKPGPVSFTVTAKDSKNVERKGTGTLTIEALP